MAAAVPVILAVVGAAGSIYGGVAQHQASKKQEEALAEQGRLAQQEANREAARKEHERTKFIARQKMAYLANGIGISGTPLAVFEDTSNEYQQEIDALRSGGSAKRDYYLREGSTAVNTGRAQLVQGVSSGVGTLARSYYNYRIG